MRDLPVFPPIEHLAAAQQRYIRVHQCLVPAIFNVLINGLISWLLFSGLPRVPMWSPSGDPAMGVDLLLTGLLLPALTCVITTPIIIRKIRGGSLGSNTKNRLPLSQWAGRPLWLRALLLGVFGMVLAAIPFIVLLTVLGANPLAANVFILVKALWAGLLAAAISPWIAWWAIRSQASLTNHAC